MPRKRRDAGVEVTPTGTEGVTLQVAADPLSPTDRLAVEILLEMVANRGSASEGFATSAAQTARKMAEELGWK